jgi:hypothetical protein
MQTRIRHIAHKRKGTVVQNEHVLNKQTISIGRATDQDIFLSDLGVAYKHARLTLSPGGQIGVSSLSTAGFYLDGRFVQSGSLKGRGEIVVGPFSIKIESESEGFDFDITIEKIAEDVVEIQSDALPALRLEDTWLRRRRCSWIGFWLVMLLFMAIPLAGYFDDNVSEITRGSLLIPDDGAWLSGEISQPHKHFADDCETCHSEAFTLVKDEDCAQCHGSTTVHADPEMFELSELHDTRCATCHKEHNGTEYLVRQDQVLCTDCHAALRTRVETDLEDINDFEQGHAEFKPLLFTRGNSSPDDEHAWDRISLSISSIKHETGLIFPHDVHLDDNGINSPTGERVLGCSNCHQTDAGGKYMLPVRMEEHCQECHRLDFDAENPERELPHGKVESIRSILEEHYAYIALRGDYDDSDAPAIVKQRRRPGKELTREERKTAITWAREKAADVEEEVVEFRTCGLCHKVTRDTNMPSGWNVPDVQISQLWFSKGAFDHVTHRSTECADCHQAKESKKSEEVLLPGIKVCRDCHGGEDAVGLLESTCVSCHKFHTPGALLLSDQFHGDDNE